MNLQTLQLETEAWRARNFPAEHRTAVMQTLGVAEECGELCHAILKMEQGIRGNQAVHLAEVNDAGADLIIFLCGVYSDLGLNLQQAVETTWEQVSKRDWVKNPQDGVT